MIPFNLGVLNKVARKYSERPGNNLIIATLLSIALLTINPFVKSGLNKN